MSQTQAQRRAETASINEEISAHHAIIKHYRYCQDFGDRRINELDAEIAALQAKKDTMIADMARSDERIKDSGESLTRLEERRADLRAGAAPRPASQEAALALVKKMRATLPEDKFMDWFNGMLD